MIPRVSYILNALHLLLSVPYIKYDDEFRKKLEQRVYQYLKETFPNEELGYEDNKGGGATNEKCI